MGDFRPISVLNASVKIISNVLANKIIDVLGDTIDDHQTGFLKSRSILESIDTAQEVIHFTKRHKKSGFLLKFDFEKAYDTVEWDCIREALHYRGFPPMWIPWITLWSRFVKVTILVNVTQGKEISCKRGLRQGGPLSPPIFVLMADGLHQMIARCRAEGLLKGLRYWDNTSVIINLQCADNTQFWDGKCSVGDGSEMGPALLRKNGLA